MGNSFGKNLPPFVSTLCLACLIACSGSAKKDTKKPGDGDSKKAVNDTGVYKNDCWKEHEDIQAALTAAAQGGPSAEKKVESELIKPDLFDLNGDKVTDVWKFSKKIEVQGVKEIGDPICKMADLDHDGHVDYVVVYRNSVIIKELISLNYNKRMDVIINYNKTNGKKEITQRDTDGDGKLDTWEHYDENELLKYVKRDTSGDGKMDTWEVYNEGKLMKINYDTNGDGVADAETEKIEKETPKTKK